MPTDPVKDKLAARVAQIRTAHKGRGEGGFATTYAYEPTDFLEMDHGNLYITLEVLGSVKEAQELADLIIQVVTDEYYRDLNRDPLASFEGALQRLNEELAEFASSGRLGWVGSLGAVIGVLAGRTLHLTQIGDSHAYLLRGTRLSNISEGLSAAASPNPLKTFLNIASGDLAAGDRLILAGPSLFLVASREQLKKLLAELSPARTLDRLRPEFEESPKLERLAAILIEVTTEDKLAKQFVETEPSEITIEKGSLASLGAAGPIIGKVVGAGAASGVGAAAQAGSKLRGVGVQGANLLERLRRRRDARNTAIKSSGEAAPTSEATPEPDPAPEAKVAPAPVEKAVPRKPKPAKPSRPSILTRLPALPLPRPGLHRSNLLLVGLLALSLGVLGWQFHAKAESRTAQRALTSAAAKEREVKTALPAGSRDQVKALIAEADKLLGPALRAKDASIKRQAETLRATLAADQDQLDRVARLAPSVLSDLTPLGAAVNPIGLARTSDGSLYTTDRSSGAVYKISGGTPQTLPQSAAAATKSLILGSGDTPIILLDHGIAEVAGSTINKPPLTIGDWPPAVDLTSFSNFLYLLDPSAGRVWKVPKSVGGYGKPQDYLGNENDQKIKGARSLAIDGSVYVLQANGEIWKFNQGARADFKTPGLPSPIPASAKLFASETTTHLYVLNPDAGSVIFLDPTGAYQKTLAAKEWKGASGFFVDEPRGQLYVLSGKKIYRTAL